jgi:hypothetical protein
LQVVTKLIHVCTECKVTWDQDLNNTQNLDAANASGEVVSLTDTPAGPETQEPKEVVIKSMRAARKELAKKLKKE